MAERFRYTFRSPPFNFIVARLFDSEDFVGDLRNAATFPDDTISEIANQLGESTFIDEQKYRSVFEAAVVGDTNGLATNLYYLAMQARDSELSPPDAQRVFREAAESKFNVDELDKLAVVVRRLCFEPLSLDLQKKAERIAVATGHEVEELQIVCDMRPVFNANQTKIVGVFPRFTLRISYDSAGETGSLDLRLTDKDLDRLISETAKAEKKRDVVREQLLTFDLAVPNVGDR